MKPGYTEPISPIRVEEDKTVSLMEKSAYLEFTYRGGWIQGLLVFTGKNHWLAGGLYRNYT